MKWQILPPRHSNVVVVAMSERKRTKHVWVIGLARYVDGEWKVLTETYSTMSQPKYWCECPVPKANPKDCYENRTV